jgi:hypothetical protein
MHIPPREVSFLPDRFCEECGAPLTPGARFCEECGHPVPAGEEPVPPAASPKAPSVTPGVTAAVQPGPEKILAVLPFVLRQKGAIRMEEVSIVFTSRRVVTVVWTPQLESLLEPAEKKLDKLVHDLERKGGDRTTILRPLVFDPGTIFPPWEQLYPGIADIPGVALTDLEYIRGEGSSSTSFDDDLLLISSPAGEQRFSVGSGMYTASAAKLLPLIWEAMGGTAGEEIVGIIPTGFEPEREGFGFAYPFTLVVTNRRIIYAFLNDSLADVQVAYLNRLMKETGKDRQQLGEMLAASTPADAPWQGYLKKAISEIFSEDPINFFIPHHQVVSATITTGKKNKGDLLVFRLSSHEEQLTLDPGFAQLAFHVLSRALGGRVNMQ